MEKKILKRILMFGVASLLIGSSLSATAQSHGGGHGGSGGHSGASHSNGSHPHGGGWHGSESWHRGAPNWWGVGLGLGLIWDFSYYNYPSPEYYYYPSQPGVVVETPPPPIVAPANANWYYCVSGKAYYPYVSQCPEGWQIVPATPPAAPPAQ